MSVPSPTDTTQGAPAVPVTGMSPFRFPVFRRVWLASMASNFGSLIQSVGASWMMLTLTQSADMVALVQASTALPVMLLALAAGAIADGLDRRHVMVGAHLFMLLASVALAVFAWAGLLTPWLLLLFTFLVGCGGAFNSPAWQASVGDMVPREHLAGAVALNSMGFNLARSVGPAIGGAIVAAAGAAVAFGVNAVSYLALLLVLLRWRPVREPRLLPRETLRNAMVAGVRYALLSPAIRTVLVRAAVFGVGAVALMALLPLVASRLVSGGALVYGLLLGAFGVGAVGGAVGSARLRRTLSAESIVSSASAGFGLAAAVTGLSTSLPLTMAATMLAGAGWVLALSTFNVSVQLSAPRWVMARALALYQMAAFGGMAGGSWFWGMLADRHGLDTALLAGGGVLLASAALGLMLPLAHTALRNLDPLRHWPEPATAVPVQARTGPVVISVEYVIREEDIVPFLSTMAERRRMRRRDGAHKWALLRDLSDPELWIERYTCPTWLDYIRLNNRPTREDASISERLRELHRGEGPPRVRRMIERQTSTLPNPPAPEPPDLRENPPEPGPPA